MDSDAVKECMRFGASANGRLSRGMGPIFDATVGTRAHIPWFGFTVASFERGDICQTPNGVYIYDGDGRREVPVTGGRGTGMAKMKELYDCMKDGTPITHDGRWALATLEVGNAITQSGRERRKIMLSHQSPVSGSNPT